jgi:hypothetical protein
MPRALRRCFSNCTRRTSMMAELRLRVTTMIRALMLDIDGVVIRPRDGRHWTSNPENDFGLSPIALQNHLELAPGFSGRSCRAYDGAHQAPTRRNTLHRCDAASVIQSP